jgi:uncharacterized membrane protein YraQ (UPF0718 family)
MTSEKNYSGWYFLATVIVAYFVIFIVNQEKGFEATKIFINIIIKVLPIFILIIILITLTNYFIKPKTLVKYLGKKSGWKGWLIAISGGILSTGPIYMWYPLLNDLQKQGMRPSLIAVFLYNRAVKIPLMPLIIIYFGWIYMIVLLVVMIVVSIAQGWITEKLMEIKILNG